MHIIKLARVYCVPVQPYLFFCIVSGEANFRMKRTALTAGGFTQPVVAKGLIEHAQSVEKGLVQRFLWISPKPSYSKFSDLTPVNGTFCDFLGKSIQFVKMVGFI